MSKQISEVVGWWVDIEEFAEETERNRQKKTADLSLFHRKLTEDDIPVVLRLKSSDDAMQAELKQAKEHIKYWNDKMFTKSQIEKVERQNKEACIKMNKLAEKLEAVREYADNLPNRLAELKGLGGKQPIITSELQSIIGRGKDE